MVSGVGVGETRKEEGIIRWCESFGEVRSPPPTLRHFNQMKHKPSRRANTAECSAAHNAVITETERLEPFQAWKMVKFQFPLPIDPSAPSIKKLYISRSTGMT